MQRLVTISEKPHRHILGLMSGTSLDGLDIALCRVHGHGVDTALEVLQHTTRPYSRKTQGALRGVFAQSNVDMQELSLLNAEIGTLHGTWAKNALAEWGIDADAVDLIASHGQTVFHSPRAFHQQPNRPNATLQIGDGDHVAAASGIITVADFRQRHIAQGGEGAPLVIYGDQLLFTSHHASRVLVNLGGIANLTYLPRGAKQPALASDVGPANTLVDAYCQRYLQCDFDHNGKFAQAGTVNTPLLKALLAHPFYSQMLPKTTGQEIFNLDYVEHAVQQVGCQSVGHYDVVATLTVLTARVLANSIATIAEQFDVDEVFISGGGVHNPILVDAIGAECSPYPVMSIEQLGMAADAKEAALFALLANECVVGIPNSVMPHTMGKLCFPS